VAVLVRGFHDRGRLVFRGLERRLKIHFFFFLPKKKKKQFFFFSSKKKMPETSPEEVKILPWPAVERATAQAEAFRGAGRTKPKKG
jgi:hypothetical protein